MYLPALPCMDCGRGIIQVGIEVVVFDGKKQSEWTNPKYLPDFERVRILLAEANVQLREWWEPEPSLALNITDGNQNHQ